MDDPTQAEPLSSASVDLPPLVAYLPLVDQSLGSSYPLGAFTARAHNVDWSEDDAWFGNVIECSQVGRRCLSRRPGDDAQMACA